MSESVSERKPGWKALVLLLLFTLGAGGLVGFLIRNSMQFYDILQKPSFAPPGFLFPIVWSILYIAMAVSIWLVLRSDSERRTSLLVLYILQLAVNLVWPILFFVQQTLGLAFVWLLLLLALILILLFKTIPVNRIAGFLLIPYALWVLFAGVLNFCIAYLNR